MSDDYNEDKRLIRLGIDPDGDPREIQQALDRKIKELEEERRQRDAGDAPVIVDKPASDPDTPSS